MALEDLEFEKPVLDLEKQIKEIQTLSSKKGINYNNEVRELEKEKINLLKEIYSNLNAWQIVQVARHKQRPIFQDYFNSKSTEPMIKDFKEMHGDRCFGDDPAIITGLGRIRKHKVMIIGQNKGKSLEEKTKCYFGCPLAEGYRKAFQKMKFAEKYGIPIVPLIDTPGAYPGIESEKRGVAQAIAVNLKEMSRLRVPILPIIIGEGGSGGALGIGVGDKSAMLEYAYYSVISPEGCAGILWRDGKKAPEAAEALKLTSKDLYKLKLIDEVIKEPLGGAHRNHNETFENVASYIDKNLKRLTRIPTQKLVDNRYKKLRAIGTEYTINFQ